MGLTRLDVPRPAWPSGLLPGFVSALAAFTLGLAAGLLGIAALRALGAGTAQVLGLAAAPVGVAGGAALVAALWPAHVPVTRRGTRVHAGRVGLPADLGALEVHRAAGAREDAWQVRWVSPAGEVRPCATGRDPGLVAAYAEGLGRVGGYPVRWKGHRPPGRPGAPDPAALARAARVDRPAPETVVLRPRGPGWRELLLGSLVMWASAALAVAVAYPFAPGPLGFGATLLWWEGAATLLVATCAAAPALASLEVAASPAGLVRTRRLLGVVTGRRHLAAGAVEAVSLARRTRWEVFAATGAGPAGLGRYGLRDDAEAVRRLLLAALEGDAPPETDAAA